MSEDRRRERRALTPRPGYEVGYAKPPRHSRFKPGQSGNPKGRPKGAKNKRPALHEERLKAIILDEAYRGITVREGERNVTIPMAQAVMRSLAVNAAKGQHRAQRLFAELLASTESANKVLHDQWLETAIEYKTSWEKELWRREQLGITHLPEPLPHPDQVRIDFQTGTARIVGPMCEEDKPKYDWIRERKVEWEEELGFLTDERAASDNPKEIAFLDNQIAHARHVLDLIGQALGE